MSASSFYVESPTIPEGQTCGEYRADRTVETTGLWRRAAIAALYPARLLAHHSERRTR